MEYVVGFMFNMDKSEVVLIQKKRPEWQVGFLNGVGGKIEDGENTINAICREFEEETGLKTYYYDWKYLVKLVNKKPEWGVHFFCGKTDQIDKIKTTTDEEVVVIKVSNIDNEPVIPNLRWLIKMCLDDEVCGGEILNKTKIKK